MSPRHLKGVFSLMLMGHLVVAQSLLACAPSHHAGGQSDPAHHCQDMAAAVDTHNVPAHSAGGGKQPAHHIPDVPACCSLFASCGSLVYAPPVEVATRLAAIDVSVPLDRLEAPLSHATAPEPPPPKQRPY